ncbi:probable serine/threonine-protein kinase PBL7 [Tanacetum coccineum]
MNSDMKNGCIYGGSPCTLPSATFKCVQLFTDGELELATNSFSEAKLVGMVGFCNVYSGMLRDGTLSPINMLHKEGYQGFSYSSTCPMGLCVTTYTLFHGRSQALNWAIRLRIALDCVRALEFLHEHTIPSVIHRDFKYTNILVSDFGFAKIRPESLMV